VDISAIVMTFPVVGESGPTWHLRADQVAHWQVLYPALDIVAEARQALAWVEANSQKRKTASGMTKYLVRWFNRSTDRGGRSPTLITGSLRTVGNRAAIEQFLRRRNVLD
jgi:hypothetical protein